MPCEGCYLRGTVSQACHWSAMFVSRTVIVHNSELQRIEAAPLLGSHYVVWEQAPHKQRTVQELSCTCTDIYSWGVLTTFNSNMLQLLAANVLTAGAKCIPLAHW